MLFLDLTSITIDMSGILVSEASMVMCIYMYIQYMYMYTVCTSFTIAKCMGITFFH